MKSNKNNKYLGRKLYSFPETYIIEVNALRMTGVMRESAKSGIITDQFRERIMLAVTSVNGCSVCSYAHARNALETGMSDDEIKTLLDLDPDLGDKHLSPDEAPAISFAQHYADSRCKPDKQAWQTIVDRYGIEKANAILAYIRMITMGNALGARYAGISDRVKGKEYDARTSVISSTLFLLGTVPALPIAIIHSLILKLFHTKYLTFEK